MVDVLLKDLVCLMFNKNVFYTACDVKLPFAKKMSHSHSHSASKADFFNIIRGLVSKEKVRFVTDEYNLDLTCLFFSFLQIVNGKC